jgi:hypothetical protein
MSQIWSQRVMHIPFRKLRVGAIVAGATLIGPVLGPRFGAIVYALGLPPRYEPLRFQHVFGLVTYPLVHPAFSTWLSNSAFIVLACWFLAAFITERQQWALLLAGVGTGAVTFEVLKTTPLLVGTGPAAYAGIGSVVVCGYSRWRRLTNPWRVFVILSTVLMIGGVLDRQIGARDNLAAAVVGAALTVWWFVRGEVVTSEGDDFDGSARAGHLFHKTWPSLLADDAENVALRIRADRQRVGGWLLVFVVTLSIRCATAIEIVVTGPPMSTPEARNLYVAVPLWLGYVLFQLLFETVDSVMPIVGFVLLFTRSRWAPTFFKAYLSFIVFGGLVDMTILPILYPSIAAAFRAVGQSLAPLDAARTQKLFDGLRAATFGSIWLLYWLRSTRVERMFPVSNVEQTPGGVSA